MANKILESSADTKLERLNAKNTSKETIYRVLKRVVTEKAKNEKEVNEKFNEETLIGSNDARKIRENFENTSETEKVKVKIEKTEKKPLGKVKNTSADNINQINKVDGNQEQNKTTPHDVHNFVADIILNDDAFIHDKNVLEPGERFKQTLIKHSETISILLSNRKLLDTLDDSIKEPVNKALDLINAKVLAGTCAELVKRLFSDILGFFCFGAQENQKSPESINDKLIKFFGETPANEFLETEKQIDDAVEDTANQMQDSLSEQLKRICGGNSNVGTKDDYEMTKTQFGSIDPIVKSLNKKKPF